MPHILPLLNIFGIIMHIFGTMSHNIGTILHIFGIIMHILGTMPHIFGAIPFVILPLNHQTFPRDFPLAFSFIEELGTNCFRLV